RRDRGKDRSLLVLHHVHDRHHQGPLEYAGDRVAAVQGRLRQERAALADTARVLRAAAALRARRLARSVPANPRYVQGERRRGRQSTLLHGLRAATLTARKRVVSLLQQNRVGPDSAPPRQPLAFALMLHAGAFADSESAP